MRFCDEGGLSSSSSGNWGVLPRNLLPDLFALSQKKEVIILRILKEIRENY
jgi:hypothetical protein